MKTAIKQRVAVLKADKSREAREARRAEQRAQEQVLVAQATREQVIADQAETAKRVKVAVAKARAAHPVQVVLEGGGVHVHVTLSHEDGVVRQSALNALATASRALVLHSEAAIGVERARAMGHAPAHGVAGPAELARYISDADGVRQSVRFGTCSVSVGVPR